MAARVVGILVALVPSLTPRGSVEAACLPNAIPPESRANLNGLDGNSSIPFGLWVGDWDSAQLVSHVVKILAEEVVGYNSTFSGTGVTSIPMVFAMAGCRSPNDFASDPQCSGSPAFVHHAALEMWHESRLAWIRQVLAEWPEVIPEDAGNIGYEGISTMYVFNQQREEAYRAEGLALVYYRSYDAAWHRPSAYFDNYSSFDPAELMPCSETRFTWASETQYYLMVSGDHDGVVRNRDGTKSARCWYGAWWFAPACRNKPELCVPFVTGGDGWNLHEVMQQAAVYNMPLALTVAKNSSLWVSVPRKKRCLPFWWQPDSSFIDLQPVVVTFPPHNALEHAQHIIHTMGSGLRLSKWLHRHLALRAPRLCELVRRVRFTMGSINEMLAQNRKLGSSAFEEVACDWLRRNEHIWSSWIRVKTQCTVGKGLVGSDGSFVGSRANASACAECLQGRGSAMLADDLGATYTCEKCEPGRSQPSPGQSECVTCAAGSFADGHEMHECRKCNFGEYTGRLGQSACDSCPPTLITNFRGATGPEACICPEGSYRDEGRRDACLPCKEGMSCPEGSDLLGYSPQNRTQYPVVPLLSPGFWSSGEEPLSVFRCESALRCPGGTVPGAACGEKFEQRGCAACQAGFVQSRNTCVPCASGAVQALLFPVAPLVVTAAAVVALYRHSGRPFAEWDRWPAGVATAVCILLNHYLVVGIIHGLDVVSDGSSSDTFESASAVADLLSLFMPQCSGLRGSATLLALNSHGPGVLLVVFVAIWLLSQLLGLRRRSLRMKRDRLLSCYSSLVLAFFVRVVDAAFAVFMCTDNPNGLYTLVRDRSVVCYRGDWNAMAAVGALAILLWCLGLSAAWLHAVRVAPLRFFTPAFRARWAFLFTSYRPDVHWWSLVVAAKSAFLNLGPSLVHSGIGQIYWVLATLLVFTYLLVTVRPYRHLLNNSFDTFAHLSLCLTSAISFWLARNAAGSSRAQTDLLAGLLKANMTLAALPLVPVVAVMRWRDRSRSAQEREEADARRILSALSRVSEGDFHQRVRFLKCLTENDFRLISRTKDMILMEHAGKMVRRGYSTSKLTRLGRQSLMERTASCEGPCLAQARSEEASPDIASPFESEDRGSDAAPEDSEKRAHDNSDESSSFSF